MQANEYEINDSFRSSYTPLGQTWCGKNIPKVKFDTFNPPIHFPRNCPGDWNDMINQSPQMGVQIVQETANFGYNALTHNAPTSSSGYFNYMPAYNNDQCGYNPRFRKCDGTFVKLDRTPPASSVVIPTVSEGYRATPTTKTLTLKNVSGQEIGLSFRAGYNNKDYTLACQFVNQGLEKFQISMNGVPKGSLLQYGCNSATLGCSDSKGQETNYVYDCGQPKNKTIHCPSESPNFKSSYDCDVNNLGNKLNFPNGATLQISYSQGASTQNIILIDGMGKSNNHNLLFIAARFSADKVEFSNNGQSVMTDFPTNVAGQTGTDVSVSVLSPRSQPTPAPQKSYY